jgi:hypothetical protein
MVADCHSILARWMDRFSQLLNVRGFNDLRQKKLHTEESLVPEPSAFEFDMATTGQLKNTNHQVLIKSYRIY